MSDLIRRDDADAAIVACKGNGATRQACRDAIAALPAVTVGADAVLDAAHKYLLEQYGASPLAHPIDRARILAATTADEFDKRGRGCLVGGTTYLVEKLQKAEARAERLEEALQWCSGSADFDEGGVAREGWLKLCAPLLKGEQP